MVYAGTAQVRTHAAGQRARVLAGDLENVPRTWYLTFWSSFRWGGVPRRKLSLAARVPSEAQLQHRQWPAWARAVATASWPPAKARRVRPVRLIAAGTPGKRARCHVRSPDNKLRHAKICAGPRVKRAAARALPGVIRRCGGPRPREWPDMFI